jgi:hypothetical protein
MGDDNLPVQCHPKIMPNKTKKQTCGHCPDDKCMLDCKICNPNLTSDISSDC